MPARTRSIDVWVTPEVILLGDLLPRSRLLSWPVASTRPRRPRRSRCAPLARPVPRLRPNSFSTRHYDGVICDLDGVVYRGARAVPGAIESLNRATDGDIPVVFATNNASRPRTPWVITSASSASGRVVGP